MKVQHYPPIRQCLQDSGHQHPRDGLVKDGVANTDYVHHCGGAEDREHVGWHALPEVQQKALDLQMHNDILYFRKCNLKHFYKHKNVLDTLKQFCTRKR